MYPKKDSTIQPRELLKKMLLASERAIYEEIETVEQKVDSLSHKMDDLGDTLKKKSEEELLYEINPDDIRGQQGEKGEPGSQGERGLPGERGLDGKSGKNGLDGRDGRDGRDGVDGKDGSPDTSEDIRNKLELLKGDERLDKSAIKGLEDLGKGKTIALGGLAGLRVYVGGAKKGLLKEVNFKAGSGMTLAHSVVNGLDTITFTSSGGGGNQIYSEVVSFSGVTGTLANTPLSGTLRLFRGGARQQAGLTNDYTLSGATITLVTAASTNEIFLADYSY